MPSKLLSTPVNLKVYTPPCYSQNASTRYPVLFMLHGQTYSNDQWVRLGLTTTADKLISAKEIFPLIIVMPEEVSSTSDPNQSKFGEAMISEVLPWVDQNFSACESRDCRAIGGLSRGGNWAVRLGFSNPRLFAAIGAHSTPLFYGDITRIDGWVKQVESVAELPVVYIDLGKSDDERDAIRSFESELSRLGVAHEFYQFKGYHDEPYWSAHVEEYLRWYAAHLTAAE